MNSKDGVCAHSDGRTGLITISQGDHSFIMDRNKKILWASDGIERSNLSHGFFIHGGKEFLKRQAEEGKDGKSTIVTIDPDK